MIYDMEVNSTRILYLTNFQFYTFVLLKIRIILILQRYPTLFTHFHAYLIKVTFVIFNNAIM